MVSELIETLRISQTLNRALNEIEATLQTLPEARRINALRGLARAREGIIEVLRGAIGELCDCDMISTNEAKEFLKTLEADSVQRTAAQRIRRPLGLT